MMAESWLNPGRQVTDKFGCPDGAAHFVVDGRFLNCGGVSTSLELHYEEWQPDGSYKRPRTLKTIFEPGEHRISPGAGKFWFSASGPDRAPWRVHVVML